MCSWHAWKAMVVATSRQNFSSSQGTRQMLAKAHQWNHPRGSSSRLIQPFSSLCACSNNALLGLAGHHIHALCK